MIPIVDDYLDCILEGMNVLEIGCGSWTRVRDHCKEVNARYEGIDTQLEYFDKKVIATKYENLADLSYPDESFDVVIGTQSMEHWAEFGCGLGWGLFQCFRACKKGGRVLLNVPIHFHGTRHFLLGEIEKIRALFEPFTDQLTLEEWGNPPDPIPPFQVYPDYWVLRGKHAYMLDIRAVRNKPLPRSRGNRWAFDGRLGRILNYPLSFSFYLALCKLGLTSEAGN